MMNIPPFLLKTLQTLKQLCTNQRALARHLSTFLCCLAIVIRPFSRIGGSTAFLVLTLKELVFSVQENFAQQLESTIVNSMGAMVGIGWSTFGRWIAAQYEPNSMTARATLGTFFVILCFFAGFIKSRLPRLQLSTRIACFVSTWLLTLDIDIPSRVVPDFAAFVWIALTAAIACFLALVIVMLFIRWVPTNFEQEVANAFSLLQQVLPLALNISFSPTSISDSDRENYRALHHELLSRCIKLNENYSQAAFELRIGRLSLRSIRPLVGIVEHLRRELAWGMALHTTIETLRKEESREPTPPPSPPGTPAHHSLAQSVSPEALSLGYALLNVMKTIETTILLAFERPGTVPPRKSGASYIASAVAIEQDGSWVEPQLDAIREVEDKLLTARNAARELLKNTFQEFCMTECVAPPKGHKNEECYHGSVSMVALLQMAIDMRHALRITENLVHMYKEPKSRIWLPRFSRAWLGVPPGPFIAEDFATSYPMTDTAGDFPMDDASRTNITNMEEKQGLAEQRFVLGRIRTSELEKKQKRRAKLAKPRKGYPWTYISNWLTLFWTNETMLMLRMKLWHLNRTLQRSPHLHHALKNAVGVAVMTFPAWLPPQSRLRFWWNDSRGQWATISYLWVLETNTGATWRTGYLRIVGTVIGCVYAYITWLISRTNPIGLTVLVTLADVPCTWMTIKGGLGPLATPLAVTLPPIAFAEYITGSSQIFRLTVLRALTISVGMLAALLMNSLVFPRHCRVLYLNDTSRALSLLSKFYLTLSHNMFEKQHFSRDERRNLLHMELEVRNAVYRLSALIASMKNEFGLIPKPLRHYQKVIAVIQKVSDILTGLRKIRQNIPRKEAVLDVVQERQDFMSCVCITLFACQHAFRTREPLPQFLPSARHAFETLENHMQDSLFRSWKEHRNSMGLPLVYAFAEQELMRNMVNALEELLELTARLFGAQTWLQDALRTPASDLGESTTGWYRTFTWEDA